MSTLFLIANIVILIFFIWIMRPLTNVVEILNTTRKPIKFNPEIPMSLIFIWKLIKKYIAYSLFFIFPFVSINVPSSGSMTPTFRTWDIIYSSHNIYGLNPENISIKFVRDIVRKYWTTPIFAQTEPQINDSIVFRVPNSDTPYSKRIIAKEGDEVYIRGNIITINGQVCQIKFIEQKELVENKLKFKVNIYTVMLPDGIEHFFALDENIPLSSISEHQYFKVPKDMFICIGDYMTNSADSRTLIGDVHRNHIFAKLQWIISRNPNIKFLNPIDIVQNTEFAITDL